MAVQREIFTFLSVVMFVTTRLFLVAEGASDGPIIGVNLALNGDHFPRPDQIINLCKIYGIKHIRLYETNLNILNGLRGTGIKVTVGVKNADMKKFASSTNASSTWVDTNILPYKHNVIISFVTVGDDAITGADAAYVAQAMSNIKSSLVAVGLGSVLVSTGTAFNLQESYPPSAGAFPHNMVKIIKDVTNVLRKNGAPLFVNIFPYFAHVADPKHVSLGYATFRAEKPVIDGQYVYTNLLEAQVDAYYAALEKIGAADVPIVVGATGWPTAGNKAFATVENAQAYNQNLVTRIKTRRGTPRAPDTTLDAFIFSLFDENKKPKAVDQHWGVFLPDMDQKYQLLF